MTEDDEGMDSGGSGGGLQGRGGQQHGNKGRKRENVFVF